ncbi:MerR family transcriptional regulator [Pseudomonas viridiflava]|uniref:MerR family transcriptional regulator n=1 Tax=Pseudomonas viridiflava TaxID=33069 RepID=UPI000F072081|nr:MerR family transcriptional regulator [Pseudomonas viridiflava]
MTESPISLESSTGLKQEELFPIREVARITGINPVTLRAWERRYGLIQPTRTESGHRLYSQADIDDVRSILGWIERGVAVSKVGKILAKTNDVRLQASALDSDVLPGDWAQLQQQIKQAVGTFDESRLEQLYGRVFASYPMTVVFEEIFLPVWRELLLHHDQFGQVSEWLFLDSFLRARALQRLHFSRNASTHKVLVAAVPGQCRELELWVAGLLIGSPDLDIQVLALGQPLEELTLVCGKVEPLAVVLYSNHPPAVDFSRRLKRLALALDCPLLLAGEGADLARELLEGSPVACLGSEGRSMQRGLQLFLKGRLDS